MGNKGITKDGFQRYKCQKREGSVYVLFHAAVRQKSSITSQFFWTQATLKSGWTLLLTGGRV